MERQDSIIASIGFDRHTEVIVETAAALARKTGKTLHLVNVVEPWLEQARSRPYGGRGSPLWDVTQAIETNAKDVSEERLREIGERLPNDVRYDTKVILAEKAADGLAAEALASGACMILCGGGTPGRRLLPHGISTALSLMAHAPVPVMVLDPEMEVDLSKKSARFLLADDLSEKTDAACEYALDLASSFEGSELHHVHINSLTLEALQNGLQLASSATHTGLDDSFEPDEIHNSLMQQLEQKLSERTRGRDEYLEGNGGTYHTQIETGDVAETMTAVVDNLNPDVIIFGRHQTFHRKPFNLGRVPFRTMLHQKHPVIVVPPNI